MASSSGVGYASLSSLHLLTASYSRLHERLAASLSLKLRQFHPSTKQKASEKKGLGRGDIQDSERENAWQGFPHDQPFYNAMVHTLIDVAHRSVVAEQEILNSMSAEESASTTTTSHLDSIAVSSAEVLANMNGFSLLVHLLLEWIPQRRLNDNASSILLSLESVPEIESRFAFPAFAARISGLKLSDQQQLDVVETVVLFIIADILALALSREEFGRSVSPATMEVLAQVALALVRPSKPRALLDASLWSMLQSLLTSHWSRVISGLSLYVLPFVTKFMTNDLPRLPVEVQLPTLQALKLRFDTNYYYYSLESDTTNLLTVFLAQFLTKEKTPQQRIAQIETMDAWLMTLDLHMGGALFDLVKPVYKLIEKAVKSDETEMVATKLATTILSHGPESFLEGNIDLHLSKVLLKGVWNPKKKEYCLESILRLLRGRYTGVNSDFLALDSGLSSQPATSSSTSTFGGSTSSSSSVGGLSGSGRQQLPPYAYAGLASTEDKMLQHLITINSAVFGQKSLLPKIEQSFDICAEIVVQMTAHNLKFGLSSVFPQLLTGPLQHRLVALRALRRMLDPSSGFLEHAYCITAQPTNKDTDADTTTEQAKGSKKEATAAAAALSNLLAEAVTSIVTTCYQQWQRDTKDVSKYEPISLQFPILYADAHHLTTFFKAGIIQPDDGLRSSYERLRLLASTSATAASRRNQRELDQINFLVEDRIRRWCVQSGLVWNGGKLMTVLDDEVTATTPTAISATPASLSSSSSSASSGSASPTLPTAATSAASTVTASSGDSSPSSATGGSSAANAANSDNGGNGGKAMGQANQAGAQSALGGGPLSDKKWKRKLLTPEKMTIHSIAKEAIGCIELLEPASLLVPHKDFFIGQLLLHYDVDISQAVSIQLQKMIVQQPHLRPLIVTHMLSFIVQFLGCQIPLHAPPAQAEENNVYALFTQLLMLLDLWSLSLHREATTGTTTTSSDSTAASTASPSSQSPSSSSSSSSSTRGTSSKTPPPPTQAVPLMTLLDRVESVAVVALCEATPVARVTAFSLANAVEVLRDRNGLGHYNKGISWLLRVAGTTIVQRARHALLTDIAQGQPSLVRMASDRVVLKVEQAALSRQELLWSYILAEIISALIERQLQMGPGATAVLRFTRGLVMHRVDAWKIIGAASSTSGINIALPAFVAAPFTATATAGPSPTADSDSSSPANLLQSAQTIAGYPDVHFRYFGNLPVLYRNIHTVLFSAMAAAPGSGIDDPQSTNFQETATSSELLSAAAQYVDETSRREESSLQSYLSSYLAFWFKNLQFTEDDPDLLEAMLFAGGRIHWRSASSFVSTLWYKYYQALSPKKLSKKKMKARVVVASFLRRIAQLPTLRAVIQLERTNMGGNAYHPSHSNSSSSNSANEIVATPLIRVYMSFIEEIAPLFSAQYAKTASVHLQEYFLNNASIVTTFMRAVELLSRSTPYIICPQTGPLRKFLSTTANRSALDTLAQARDEPSSSVVANVDWRSLCDLMQSWSYFGKGSTNRKNMDSGELTKLLSRIKDARRDAKKAQFDTVMAAIHQSATLALEQLTRLGLSIGEGVSDVLDLKGVLNDWIFPSERKYAVSLLRWFLASHFHVLLPVFIDRCYGKSTTEGLLFSSAIYDQFLDSAATSGGAAPPLTGVTEYTTQYFGHRLSVFKERLRLERSALRREDKDLSKHAVLHGGALIFLGLLNLTHSGSATARARSLEFMYRLGPIAFGYGHAASDPQLVARFHRLKETFVGRAAEEAAPADDSLEVSALVADSCTLFTEDVFTEAFVRFPTLTGSQKVWAVQVLTCWLDNIQLDVPTEDPSSSASSSSADPSSNNGTGGGNGSGNGGGENSGRLRRLTSSQFLEHLFSIFTQELATKSYTQQPLVAMWLRLAARSNSNLQAVLGYLIRRASLVDTQPEDISMIKMIILELYKHQATATATIVSRYLSAASVSHSLVSAAAATAATASASLTPAESSAAVFASTTRVRTAVLAVLTDLVICDFTPLVRHLPIIFNYIVLTMSDSSPPESSTLLRALLIPIKNILLNKETKNTKHLVRTNGVLDVLIALLKHNLLKVDWAVERSMDQVNAAAAAAAASLGSTSSATQSSSASAGAAGANTSSSDLSSSILSDSAGTASSSTANNNNAGGSTSDSNADPWNQQVTPRNARSTLRTTGAAQMLEWASTGVAPAVLLAALCQAAYWIDPTQLQDIRSRLSDELLQWIRQYHHGLDMAIWATKAVEMLRSLLAEPGDEEAAAEGTAPDALLPDHIMLSGLRLSLLEVSLYLEKAMQQQGRGIGGNTSSTGLTSVKKQQRQFEGVNLLRSRISELLDTFVAMARLVRDEASFLELFWIGVSFARLNPINFASFYEKAVLILHHLIIANRPLLLRLNPTSVPMENILSRAKQWGYAGLLPLLFRSTFVSRTERLGLQLACQLVELEEEQAAYTASTTLSTANPSLGSSNTNVDGSGSDTGSRGSLRPNLKEPERFPLLGLRQDTHSLILFIVGVLPWLYYHVGRMRAEEVQPKEPAGGVSTTLELDMRAIGAASREFSSSPFSSSADTARSLVADIIRLVQSSRLAKQLPSSTAALVDILGRSVARPANNSNNKTNPLTAEEFVAQLARVVMELAVDSSVGLRLQDITALLDGLLIEGPNRFVEPIMSALRHILLAPSSDKSSMAVIASLSFDKHFCNIVAEATYRTVSSPTNAADISAITLVETLSTQLIYWRSIDSASSTDQPQLQVSKLGILDRSESPYSLAANMYEPRSLARAIEAIQPLTSKGGVPGSPELAHARNRAGHNESTQSKKARKRRSSGTGATAAGGGKKKRKSAVKPGKKSSAAATVVAASSGSKKKTTAARGPLRSSPTTGSSTSASAGTKVGALADLKAVTATTSASSPRAPASPDSSQVASPRVIVLPESIPVTEDTDEFDGIVDGPDQLNRIYRLLTSPKFAGVSSSGDDTDDDDDSDDDTDDDDDDDDDTDSSSSSTDSEDSDEEGDDDDDDGDDDDDSSKATPSYISQFDLSGIDLAPFTSDPKSPSRIPAAKREKVPRVLSGGDGVGGSGAGSGGDERRGSSGTGGSFPDTDGDGNDLLAGDSIERALAGLQQFDADDHQHTDISHKKSRRKKSLVLANAVELASPRGRGLARSSNAESRSRSGSRQRAGIAANISDSDNDDDLVSDSSSDGRPTDSDDEPEVQPDEKPRKKKFFFKSSKSQKAMTVSSQSTPEETAPRSPKSPAPTSSGGGSGGASGTSVASQRKVTLQTSPSVATSPRATTGTTTAKSPSHARSKSTIGSPTTPRSKDSSSIAAPANTTKQQQQTSSAPTPSSQPPSQPNRVASTRIGMKLQVVGPDGRNVELEKILTNPKQRGRFIEWVKKNNYNLDVFYLLEAIVEFKRSKDSAKLSKRAKKIMDRYFPKKQALTVLELPEPIRTETITSYEKQANTLTKEFFARLETYVSQQLVKDFLPMFIKSDFFKEVDS